ncbi:single-stranded DNA-binding protein [Tissierella sp.]|uniref:single-stranded DNA-binding protein n=1 Tax=Tissierella sp. TaxID=41274 RepID=UPI002854E14A|nr:single-stranded DNA-binding protein [Tissierella sp.]MDR7856040.1 single-stranded DNA-binding protein [Tissierella sp.]
MNNVVLIGRLTRDPELRYLPAGTAVCKFSLAVEKGLSKEKKQEMESRNQPTADFINIVVWGKMGENCANFLAKGRLVGIQGRIQSGSYDKDGVKYYTTDVVATNVEFLEWGDKQQSNNAPSTDFGGIEGFNPTSNDDIPF